jgi:hypothetical protein
MNTLSHEQAIRRLHEAVHYLSIEQQSDLAAHLAECDQCRAYADQLTTLQPRLTQALRARPYSSSRLPGPTIRSIQKHQRRLIMRKQLFGIATVLTVGLIVLVALSVNRYPGSTSAGWQPSPTATPTATPTFIPTIVSALPTPTPANTFMSILPTPTPATDDSKHFK